MRRQTKGIIILALAVLFFLAGVVSLALPLIPGWILFGIGLILLSLYSPRFRKWMEQHTRRWPKMHSFVARLQEWADKNIGDV